MYTSNAQNKRIREERKELGQDVDDFLLFYKEEIKSQGICMIGVCSIALTVS